MWGMSEVSSFISPSEKAALAAWNEYKCYLLIFKKNYFPVVLQHCRFRNVPFFSFIFSTSQTVSL